MDERHGDVQPSLHPPGIPPRDAVGRLGEPEPLEQARNALLERVSAHAVQLALETQVLAPRRLDIDARALCDDANRPADAIGLRGDVDPGDDRPPLVRLRQRGEDLDRGRLAGAVRAEQPEDRPRLDGEREPPQRLHVLGIRLHEALGLNRKALVHIVHFVVTSGYHVFVRKYLSL